MVIYDRDNIGGISGLREFIDLYDVWKYDKSDISKIIEDISLKSSFNYDILKNTLNINVKSDRRMKLRISNGLEHDKNSILLPIMTKKHMIKTSTDRYRKLFNNLFTKNIIYKLYDYMERNPTFYSIFKNRYFEPILKAEYNRMCVENINYAKEKPFIICLESALSRMFTDTEYMKKIKDQIIHKLYKTYNKMKFKILLYDHNDKCEQVISSDNKKYKLSKYFYLGKQDRDFFTNRSTQIIELKIDNNTYVIDFGVEFCNIYRLLNSFIKEFLIMMIKKEVVNDLKQSINDSVVIDSIKNELSIFYTRNASVFKEYLDEFYKICDKDVSKRHYTTNNIMRVITANFITKYEKYDFTNFDYNKTDESIISNCLASTYMIIGKIESLNRDYTDPSNVFAMDASYLNSVFENMVVTMKSYNKIINKLFYIFNSDLYFKIKTHYVNSITIDYFINDIISRIDSDEIITYFDKDAEYITVGNSTTNVIIVPEMCTSDTKFIELIDDLNSIIENIKTIYIEYEHRSKTFTNNIDIWVEVMKRNIDYHITFDPIQEFESYVSDKHKRTLH